MKKLVKIFSETLDKENSSYKKPVGQFKIKPSVVGSPCMRKVLYASAQVEEDFPFSLEAKRRMKVGDAVHEMLHEVFLKSGILIEYRDPDGSIRKDFNGKDDFEFPLKSPDLFIKSGKIDAVMVIDGELWLGEYKSINMNGFSGLTAPKYDHLIQATIYWYLFNQALSEGQFKHIPQLDGFVEAKGVRFLYVNKDDTEMKEFVLTDAEELFQQIVEKILTTKHNFDNKILPPKTQDWCNSCSWRLKCKTNQGI